MFDLSESLIAGLVAMFVVGMVTEVTPAVWSWALHQRARYRLWRLDNSGASSLAPEALSQWALLHDELRSKIISSLSLEAKLVLGNTCRAMRRLCNSPSLWRTIRFSPESAPKLTDEDLRLVLLRVNAKQHTEHVSLCGCTSLTGEGLEPLRYSSALLEIDLRVNVAARGMRARAAGDYAALDPHRVAPILESCLPMRYSPLEDDYRLDRIHVNSLRRPHRNFWPLGAHPELERAHHRRWVALMRWASASREQRDPVMCGHCGEPCDETGPLGVLSCSACGVVTCHRYEGDGSSDENEPGHGHSHSHAHVSRDKTCPSAFECDLCRRIFCAACDAGDECVRCGTIVCTRCAVQHGACLCSTSEAIW
jgi:hypothetical protein